ncbi:MAG: HEPN domain-containing protein [Deltaproteobacteria bacterium]|nr:HEPN domain-containing protein [Deltaproteobacteria bacterium]
MPYATSLARKEFLLRTNSILKICRNETARRVGLPSPAIELLFQAAIFKTSAFIEVYLNDIISDWLHDISIKGFTAVSLPEDLKWFSIVSAHIKEYEKFFVNKDEERLINSIKNKRQNQLLDNASSVSDLIHPNAVLGGRKYPSTKNIKLLFVRIGISDIFHLIDRRGHCAFQPIIQSFLDIRQAIAHQSPPALTLNDVTSQTHNVQRFIAAIDRELFSHVIRCHGNVCWRRN